MKRFVEGYACKVVFNKPVAATAAKAASVLCGFSRHLKSHSK